MKEALFYENLGGKGREKEVLCRLCAHYCLIKDGDAGECLVRVNKGGRLYTYTWGKAGGTAIDPIEKKPFYHFKPGTYSLSFGTPGCNFKCENCQNWDLSQSMDLFGESVFDGSTLSPEKIIQAAINKGAQSIAYTYTEPIIFYEYARDVILGCRAREEASYIDHLFISNGYFSKELIDMFEKEYLIDAVNVDLKFMDNEKYERICNARLKPVLRNIKLLDQLREKLHMEIINLVIPGENDSDSDLRRLCEFIASVSPDIPLHFSRFYPQFKMDNRPATPISRLQRALEIAKETGLKYVFIGNASIPGASDTYCPNCGITLVERSGYSIKKNLFKKDHKPVCANCGEKINIVL